MQKKCGNAIKPFGGKSESKKDARKHILKQHLKDLRIQHRGFTKAMRDSKVSQSVRDSWSRVSTEDANQNFLRSLFHCLIQVSLNYENKPGIYSLSFNDLTNEFSTSLCVPNTSGHYSKLEQISSYSMLASQSSCPQLDHEDLDQVDEYDLEEMDLNAEFNDSHENKEVLQEDL
ncbi:hypothetical protein Tco_0562574 [Tanacetum coccineum]